MLEQADDGVYQIATAEELWDFAEKVNDGETTANAILTANIDLNNQPWTPIGSDSHLYTGTFNGAGHTISGLTINDSRADDQGLFGYVGTGGTVKDLTVSGSVKGDDYVGGVVGYNDEGRVENCHNIGSVSGERYVGGVVGYNDEGRVKNCHNIGEVSGDRVGGVVGYNNGGTVENCYNTGKVSGPDSGNSVIDSYVGGVVGRNFGGTVENCYNTGSVKGPDSVSGSYVGGVVGDNVGNVVGYNRGTVENCYNTGTVTGTDDYVGGVVGYNYSGGSVTNSYNTGEVSGKISVGGVVGYNHSGGSVTGCYFLQQGELQGIGDDADATGAAVVNDLPELCKKFENVTDTWTISENLDRPVLKDNHEDDGSEDHPYEIFTATQLENFRDLVNGEGDQAANPNAHAKLMNDINLSSVCGENAGESGQPVSWTPIGTTSKPYSGTFDGANYTISGLYIDSSDTDYQGLFGYLGTSGDNKGTVQNLSVSGSVSVSHGENVGGIVGYNFSGTVTNCAFSGSVGGMFSCSYVGGIVGYNSSGTVTNCAFSGSVSGSVSGNYVGGVVGDNRGSNGVVENCHNAGKVSGSNTVGGVVGYNDGDRVTNCTNTGSVKGSGNSVGGVVGDNDGDSVTNCYFLKTADVNEKLQGIGGGSGTSSNVEARTDDAFHSGEVAWLLENGQTDGSSQVWGQSNLKDENSWPTLVALDKDENAKPVYKVAFISDDTEIDAKYANIGMTVDLPATEPTKEGYTFSYWQDKAGTQVTEPITVTADTTYTAKWTPHTYSITASPSALNFGSITEGDAQPAAQEVTITNTGNQRVTLVQPTAENFEITTSDSLTLAPDAIATFTIQPKDKLPRGSYSEQITITGDNNVSETLTATFTVKEPPYSGKYSYEVFTSVGDNGAISVDRYATEGDKVTIDVTPDQAYKLDDLTVTAHGKDVELTANGDGTYSFTMPSADVKITATFAEDPDWTEPEEPTTDVSDLFIDIAPDAWYKDAVQYAYDNGLMTGVSATEFDPEATTTRAMIVSILARLEGVTTAEAAGFADVDDEWYATAVNWAANVGVVNGYEDNTFKPNTAITREQLAAILMNYAAYKGEDVSNRADLDNYTDQPSTWAQEAMQWAVAEGLISGVTADTLQPQGAATRAQVAATRAQVAAILQRFLSE